MKNFKRIFTLLVSFVLLFNVTANAKAGKTPFTDVEKGSWYEDAVAYAYENGLISGTSEAEFSPEMLLSRAQLDTILWRKAGEPYVNFPMSFYDFEEDAWYAEAVRWAVAEKIDDSNGDYLWPYNSLSRDETVAILYNYAKYSGIDVSVGEDTNILSYDDFSEIDEAYIPAMQWAVGTGIIQGTDEDSLSPKWQLSRAQAAAVLQRFSEGIKVESLPSLSEDNENAENETVSYNEATSEETGKSFQAPEDDRENAVASAFSGMAAAEFSDVAESDYFYNAVNWGVESGITYGVDEEHFAPEGEVTRAQAVTFLWRMAGQPEPITTETFRDVEAGIWYETAVAWAVENNITEGTGNNMFSPDVICDRAMCITLLYRMMNCPWDGIDLTADIELNENSTMEDYGFYMIKSMVTSIRESDILSDVPTDSYFELPVFWGMMNGIITADNSGISEENTLFRSTDPCVRGEMISFLYQTKLLEDAKNAPITYESGPVVFPIPKKYYDAELLSFYVYGITDEEYIDEDFEEENVIVVYEKASQEAAEAMGEDTEGAGELCRIVRVTEDKLHSLLSGDMSGIKVFAKDAYGKYYLFCTPTDVCIVRRTNEELNDGIEQWSELNEWARGELCNEILSNSSELIPVNFTNTELDMYLARIAYDDYTDYTISMAEFGELKPQQVDAKPYIERLLEGTFVEIEDLEAPEGEYFVLNFPKDKVRYDFFVANKNLVREVRGESETIYKRGFNNSEGGINNTDIIQEWYYALAEKAGKK